MDKVKDYAMRAVDWIRAHPKTAGVVFVAVVLALLIVR